MTSDRRSCICFFDLNAVKWYIVAVIALAQTDALRLTPTGIFAPRLRNTWMMSESEVSGIPEYFIDRDTITPKLNKKDRFLDSTYTQVMSSLDLKPVATKLRQRYDDHFEDPRQPDINRFCWDPWCVNVGDGLKRQPNDGKEDDEITEDASRELADDLLEGEEATTNQQIQYSLKRIQASTFFSEDEFEELVDKLTQLGRSIGLVGITPPWMSLYTNGDMQNFHTDSRNGPCAFVLSLSHEGHFQGGETMLLKPQVLEFWRGFDGSKGLEAGGIMRYISPAPLGKCILFDPRVPHGVSQVTGTSDPRKGRLAIHGWLSQPEVCWFGPWSDESVVRMTAMLDEAFKSIVEGLGSDELGRVMGYLACRLEIYPEGGVKDIFAVCDTLQADVDDFKGIIGYDPMDKPIMEDAVADVKFFLDENLMSLIFEEGDDGRSVVVPFHFE